MKAASDMSAHESSYQKTEVAFREKSVMAPLARMESLAEVDDEPEQVMPLIWHLITPSHVCHIYTLFPLSR